MKFRTLMVVAALASLSVGCSKKKQVVVQDANAETVEAEISTVAEAAKTLVHLTDDHITIDEKIHFASDSDVIEDDSSDLLDQIAALMAEHKEISVLHIIGHTDSSGDDDHNMELSERRAAAVVTALRDRGVSQTVDSRGAGETAPACTEDTDECHETNRRVEFLIEKAES